MNFSIPIKLLLSSAFVLVFSAATAYADVINVTGTSQGAFNGNAPSDNPTLGTQIWPFLQPTLEFQGQAFNQAITTGNPPVQVVVGSFLLRPFSQFDFGGDTFTLSLTFTAPPGAPGGGQTFTANLSGVVAIDFFTSSVTIDFDNTTQVFAYTGGTFSVSVDDLTVQDINAFAFNNNLLNGGNWVNVIANISATSVVVNPNTPVPEPLSMMLLGSGLAGLAVKLRRRNKSKQD